MNKNQDYSKCWFPENKITPGPTVCTQNINDHIGHVNPYAPEGGPLRARGKMFGLYGITLSSIRHIFSTALCQLNGDGFLRKWTNLKMSPKQRKMHQWNNGQYVWVVDEALQKLKKNYRVRAPSLQIVWAGNFQSFMPFHLQQHLRFSTRAKRGRPTCLRPCGCQPITPNTQQSVGELSIYPTKRQYRWSDQWTACYKDDMWEWYSMGASQDDSTSGFAEQMITRGILFVPGTCRLHMKMIFHVVRSKLPNIWIRRK